MRALLSKAVAILALSGCLRAAENADAPVQTATAVQPANPALTQSPENEGLYDRIEKCCTPRSGIQFQILYSGEVLGNVSGGARQGAIYEGLLKAGLQIDLEKVWGWKEARFFAGALYAHGPSLTQNYVHDLNVVSNIDAYDSLRLNELWFEQGFLDGRFSIRLGQLAADTEFFVCDSGGLFINSSFGVLPIISLNFEAPTFPLTAPGLRMEWKLNEAFLWRTGIFSGDLGSQSGNNKHGARFSINSDNGAFILTEAVYKINAGEGAKGPPGVFKLGGFYQTGEFPDVSGSNITHRGDYGAYVISDQAIYREHSGCGCKDGKECAKPDDQGLNVFGRAGFAAPASRNLVSGYVEGGLTYKGLIPGRDKDVCGLACSYTRISNDVHSDSGGAVQTHHETVIEATYQAALTDWLTFQPEFQYVINPGAIAHAPNAVVIGARFSLTF